MLLNKLKIKKILVVSLSNLGDVILTFPVIDILISDFPHAEISVVVGPKARFLFDHNDHIKSIFIFDKKLKLLQKYKWVRELRKGHFDLCVDLRQTAIPLFLWPCYHSSIRARKYEGLHMKEKHLQKLREIYDFKEKARAPLALKVSDQDKAWARETLKQDSGYAVLGCGAADHKKRWNKQGFARLADEIIERFDMSVIFVGDASDQEYGQEIQSIMKHKAQNLCGQTNLTQLSAVIGCASFVVANDSAIVHMASYLNRPTYAIFGPSDPSKYGPWSREGRFFIGHPHDQMASIHPEEILKSIKLQG